MAGKPGGQCPARHDVFGHDLVRRRIEIDAIAAADVDGADAQSRRAGVQAVEIDEFLQCAFQLTCVVKAGRFDCPFGLQPLHRCSRAEKTLCAAC